MPPDQPGPVGASGTRVASLDFIRGVAVTGILAANIVAFGQPMTAYMYPDAFASPHGEADQWMWVAQFLLVDGKFRGLFSLLFGAGLYLFMERAWARGATLRLQVRRLFWLAVFGLAHFYLIWRGDILFGYAITGLVALPLLRWPAKRQLGVGVAGFILGAIALAAMMSVPYLTLETSFGDRPVMAEQREQMIAGREDALADGEQEVVLVREGAYGAIVAHGFARHAAEPFSFVSLYLFETLPLMLIGMGLYRLGLFDGGINRATLMRWGWAGVIIGTVLSVPVALWAKAQDLSYYSTLAAFLGIGQLPRLFAIVGLAALLTVAATGSRNWLGQRICAAGRAAFTNYLGTSIAMMLLFHGWAGGLFGYLTRAELYVVTVIAWIVMLLWSKPWLDRYRFGPFEWLWRCLTYGRIFPLRRDGLANENDSQ